MRDPALEELDRRAAALERELRTVQNARSSCQEQAAKQRAEALTALLTPAVIQALAPEHDRTSCSDTNVCNGGYTRLTQGPDIYLPRCARCFLLSVLRDGDGWPFELKATLQLEVSPPWAVGK